jgi:hypothetical protein
MCLENMTLALTMPYVGLNTDLETGSLRKEQIQDELFISSKLKVMDDQLADARKVSELPSLFHFSNYYFKNSFVNLRLVMYLLPNHQSGGRTSGQAHGKDENNKGKSRESVQRSRTGTKEGHV